DRDPEPLARPDDDLRLPGWEGRVRREAVQPQHPRGPDRGRDGPQAQAGRPARHPEPGEQQLGPARGPGQVRQARQTARLPRTVLTLGGRFTGTKDQGQTPNELVTVMDYGETLLVFETRGLKSKDYYGQNVGNILHFEAGTVAGGKFYPKGSQKAEPLSKIE